MLIAGEWRLCDDGIARPVVRARVSGADGRFWGDDFLIDSGADRTVFSAALMAALRLPTSDPPAGSALVGVGGRSAFVEVKTVLEFTQQDDTPVHVRGTFGAFTDPTATDLSIVGRDVLNLFDVILSRRRGEVLLLASRHQYRVDRE